MANYESEVERLISASPERLPLIESELRPAESACHIGLRDAADFFPAARQAEAALAGLLLRAGCWSASHEVAQDIHSAEGSYWHGIIHRMEPDSHNAGYWFRRVGDHAIFPELLLRAANVLKISGSKHWTLKSTWDPLRFISWCEEGREKGGQAEEAAIEIQMAEWQLLFDWCRGER